MIGDYVRYIGAEAFGDMRQGDIVKVDALQGKYICVGNGWAYCDMFAPIPLIAEILVKNGWEEKPDVENAVCEYRRKIKEGEGFFTFDMEIRIDCDPYGDYHLMHNGTSFCYVTYVHQLQHALQLLGVTKEIEL